MKVSAKVSSLYSRILELGIGLILLLMPFHAFLVVTASHFLGLGVLFQSWKELLIVALVGVWVLYCVSQRKLLFKLDLANWLVLGIMGLSLLVTLFIRPTPVAILFGIKTNLVALGLFLIAQIPLSKSRPLKKYLLWVVLVPAGVVSVLALLQSFAIPPSFIEQLGYSATTIDPTQHVDAALSFYRAFSTLGGPNQLGAYLIVPMVFATIYALKTKKYWLFGGTGLILVALVVTYSRSAWLGAVAALLVALLLMLKGKARLLLVGGMIVAAIFGGAYVYNALNTPSNPVQYLLLHGRVFENRIEGSDQGRLEAFTSTTDAIAAEPWGHGIGSAGPASFNADQSVIPENWYLQIAYEIGVFGLILYIGFFAVILGDFWRHRADPLAASLFAATVGVLVANLFLHAWADSTLSLILFALYGLYKGQRT